MAPLAGAFEGIGAEDAYEIQLINIRHRTALGAQVTGHKVGLSSPVMQRMMGVDEPDYGHLLDDMELREDQPVDTVRYCAPRVEVEIGFVLGDDLPGEGCTPADVLAATERVVPATGVDRQPDRRLAHHHRRHDRRQRLVRRLRHRRGPSTRATST